MAIRKKHPRTPKPLAKDKRPDQKIAPGINRAARENIGNIVAAWSSLEAAMQAAIWAFLKLNEDDGRLVTARMDARPKIDWLRVLGERYLLDGEYAAKFFEALSRISELQDDRNFIAHGVWGTLKPHPLSRPSPPPSQEVARRQSRPRPWRSSWA